MQEEDDFLISPVRNPAGQISTTVVIPVFNAEATLLRAAQSALEQTSRDIEVIIVDDASTDSSWQTICTLLSQDSRVRALRNKQNRGKSVGMNRAMTVARGQWLAVLDADDWYHADRLCSLMRLANRQAVDMVADNQFLYDARADRMVCTAWHPSNSAWELSFDDFLIGSDAYENFNLGMLKPVMKVDFMRKMGRAYEEKARQGEDFLHLFQFFLAGGKAAISDRPFYYYTQPFGTISHQWSHTTRTRYDFQNAFEVNQRHFEAAVQSLTLRQRALLETRNRNLLALETYFSAKSAAARHDWRAAIATLAGYPAALDCLLWRLRHRFLSQPTSRAIDRIAARSRQRTPLDIPEYQPGATA